MIQDFCRGLLQGFTPGLWQQGPVVKFAVAVLFLPCFCQAVAVVTVTSSLNCRELAAQVTKVLCAEPH